MGNFLSFEISIVLEIYEWLVYLVFLWRWRTYQFWFIQLNHEYSVHISDPICWPAKELHVNVQDR